MMNATSMSRREAIVLLAALGLPVDRVLAAEAPRAAQSVYRVLFENELVRVLEYVSAPDGGACGTGSHFHPAHLSIYMTPARIRGVRPDGSSAVAERRAGEVAWFAAGSHAADNVGSAEARVLMVELKDKDWRPS